MTRAGRQLVLLLLGLLVFEYAAAEARPLAGKLIHFQGQVTIRRGGEEEWQPARLHQELFAGDAVKTGPVSRAAILAADESQIILNENTFFLLKQVSPSPRLGWQVVTPAAAQPPSASLYQVPQGELWLRNSNEKFLFELETPAVTAALRGTEFNLRVTPDGATALTLLTGALVLRNPQGQVNLDPGEEGLARPGEPPSKRVLVQPQDAVQWCLTYPGIVSFRDLPLTSGAATPQTLAGSPAAAPLVQKAEASYNQGRLEEARHEAEEALRLDPGNPRALTVLGWLALQRHDPKEALKFFSQVSVPHETLFVGLALSRYRLGEVSQAYELMAQARGSLPPTALLSTMSGYFALMAGKVVQAHNLLEEAAARDPGLAFPRALLAQIYLVQNRKEDARKAAAQALAANPRSPVALLSQALVELSYFKMDEARRYLDQAVTADPNFLDAHLYLARIWLGSDYLDRARRTLETALNLAPWEAEVLSLAGFVHLGYRDYQKAREYFSRAAAANPRLGDPHLGLGHIHFRYRNFQSGLAEILTATLLEPRMSLYQSFLGKALYQVRVFDKALETYDYAKTLDPRDPTPYLYKGIALTDLNRPGEAVQEINRSIELNDNRAVFRSRLMLDRDLAVRNYNLAYAYGNLGLGEWSFSKALTAVKADPTNSSAQLFLATAFQQTRQRVGAGTSALLLYRLLSPANQNTFATGNDYTPMFEMPYLRVLASASGSFWGSGDRTRQDYMVNAYGGLPGVALALAGFYTWDEGFRAHNADLRNYAFDGWFKWDLTPKTSLAFFSNYYDTKQGDRLNLSDYYYRYKPFWRQHYLKRYLEGGLVHRFAPHAVFMAYLNYTRLNVRKADFESGTASRPDYLQYPAQEIDPGFPPGWYARDLGTTTFDYRSWSQTKDNLEFINPQVQQMLILGKHTLIAGFDYFRGKVDYRYWEKWLRQYRFFTYGNVTQIFNTEGNLIWQGPLWDPYTFPLSGEDTLRFLQLFRLPKWTYTFYLLDYWRVTPKLTLELGLTYEALKMPNEGVGRTFTKDQVNPRVGLNYQITPQQVVRFGAYTTLSPHTLFQPTLMPAEVAGLPYQINSFDGADVREMGLTWEAQWSPKTFTVLRASAARVANPYLLFRGPVAYLTWYQYNTDVMLNHILGPFWGLTLGLGWKRVDPRYQGGVDFNELSALGRLTFWHKSGLRAYVAATLVYQKPDERKNELFVLGDFGVGYEFPRKRGEIFLNVSNVFNRHFTYLVAPIRLDPFYASRLLTLRMSLYY